MMKHWLFQCQPSSPVISSTHLHQKKSFQYESKDTKLPDQHKNSLHWENHHPQSVPNVACTGLKLHIRHQYITPTCKVRQQLHVKRCIKQKSDQNNVM